MPTSSNPPQSIDALPRVIEAREAEVALLKLTVEKLTLQMLKSLLPWAIARCNQEQTQAALAEAA